mgnify:CR=1 FL=1
MLMEDLNMLKMPLQVFGFLLVKEVVKKQSLRLFSGQGSAGLRFKEKR